MKKVYRRLHLVLLVLGKIVLKAHAQISITPREPAGREKEGSSYTFKWDFHLPSSGRLREIVFGLWEKGYTSSYFMTVTKRYGAVENPELRKKHPDYVGRVQWMGDISASYAAFRLENLRLPDNKTYGCQLGIGDYGQTIDSKITLIVQRSSLESNTSVFLYIPKARNAIVGQATEFKWEYRLSDADSKDIKVLQLTRILNLHTKQLVLWEARNNVNTTNPKYAKRLLATKNKRHNSRTLSYSFKLFNLTLDDEGNYTFKVELGSQLRNVKRGVFLDVQERPEIINPQQVKRPYREGDQLFLACDTTEQPQKIRWIKNGRVIAHQTQSFFRIKKLSISDAGVYSCCAYYPLGNATSLAVHVRVQYAPSIFFPSKTKTILSWKGRPVKLKCSAVGDPVAQFSWTRADGRMLDGEFGTFGNSSILSITPSADSDFTDYTCTARNIIGEDSRTFILKPIRPPSPPTITNIEVNYNALKVTWKTPPSKQDTPITGQVIRIKKTRERLKRRKIDEFMFQAKSNYFILRNLTKGTQYSIWLYATNVAGRSNASKEKQVKTLTEGRPDIPRLHFKDVSVNYTHYLVTWDFPDDNGGAPVNFFTVWYRELARNKTQKIWRTVNKTEPKIYLKLNCCLTYEIMVTAWNRNGPSFTDPDNAATITVLRDLPGNITSLNPQESSRQGDSQMRGVKKYLPFTATALVIPMLICIGFLLKSKIRKETSSKSVKIDDVEEQENEMEEIESVPALHTPSWEFSRSNLAIERVIGNGAFGVVSKAYALGLPDKPEWTIVAVKSLQDDATESERRDLLSELKLLKKLKPHPHIIRLLGCITADQDGPLVIIEYVPYGDLLGYLRRSRGVSDCYYDDPEIKPTTNLTPGQMLKFAWQISDGMRYISSKKIVHRDLAARNVLVGENHRCKITDFGMARDVNMEEIYVPRSEGRIPVKWTAIEAMTGAMKYTTQSDVWSFGVVLFEICTIGAEPYPGISPWKLPSILLKGYRIPKPEYVKDELYAIMLECWETEPENRPSFGALCNKIRGLETGANQNYVNIRDCLEAHESEVSSGENTC